MSLRTDCTARRSGPSQSRGCVRASSLPSRKGRAIRRLIHERAPARSASHGTARSQRPRDRLRLSNRLARACSGLMYAAVPRMTPRWSSPPPRASATSRRSEARRPDAGAHRFREAEVEDLHGAVRLHLDVRGLEVAMDDAPLMSRFQRLG